MSTRLASVKRIQEIYEKLEKKSLGSDELEELVQLSADLYEKALILRYKAAEERVFENKKLEEESKEKPQIKEEPIAEEKKLEFDIFEPMRVAAEEEPKMDETIKEAPVAEPEVDNTPVAEEPKVVVDKPIEVDISTMENISADWSNFFKKVVSEHSSGLQTKLNALSGSFGLNERILYINELFDGNAEKFSETIQHLDKLNDWPSCATKLSNLGEERNWDKENDVTGEFVIHVKRKYV